MAGIRPIEPLHKELGKAIAQLRRSRGMTQAQTDKAAGLARASVAHYENGSHRISVLSLVRICQALNVAPGEVLDKVLAREPVPDNEGDTDR